MDIVDAIMMMLRVSLHQVLAGRRKLDRNCNTYSEPRPLVVFASCPRFASITVEWCDSGALHGSRAQTMVTTCSGHSDSQKRAPRIVVSVLAVCRRDHNHGRPIDSVGLIATVGPRSVPLSSPLLSSF